ncbi:MAG: SRPBCC family protein [Xanthomonadaceae bacterium]|nr:SRPBCC family protein [Xanthomonadaceae bacterium]
MTRLLEVAVALAIVFVLAVVFAIALPSQGHVERSVTVSSPARQIFDVLDGYRTYPSWTALTGYDSRVQMTYEGPALGSGAKVSWHSANETIGDGSLTVAAVPAPEQDKQVTWDLDNNWRGTNKHFTFSIDPSENGKTSKVTMAYDVDFGWNLLARISGLYLQGDPATLMQFQLTRLQNMLATFPTVDYKGQDIQIQDVTAQPVLYISTTAKRTLDDVADATTKAMDQLQAAIKKDKLTATGPRRVITTNWGDENYDFDVALPVDRADAPVSDPVKAGMGYGGKALVTSFTGSAAQLPLMRLMLKAYAYTHGYLFDESSEGNGRFFDELTTTDPHAADDQQSFSVFLPIQGQ